MKNLKKINKQKGFTLIEILVVIGIIAILAAIVIIAINPAKQFAQARNSQRTANVNAILNAIGQRIADNKGIFEGKFNVGDDPATVPVEGVNYFCPKLTNTSILTDSETTVSPMPTSGKLGCLTPTYIAAIPTDPTWISGTNTLYDMTIDKDCDGNAAPGRIAVKAILAADETAVPNAAEICVVR